MIYIDGPCKILGKRAKLIVAPLFKLDSPIYGLNSEYIQQQTEILQNRMSRLMEEFIYREEEQR